MCPREAEPTCESGHRDWTSNEPCERPGCGPRNRDEGAHSTLKTGLNKPNVRRTAEILTFSSATSLFSLSAVKVSRLSAWYADNAPLPGPLALASAPSAPLPPPRVQSNILSRLFPLGKVWENLDVTLSKKY